VLTEEVEEREKVLLVLEQLGGEVTVEKLHTITNGFGERRLGEGGIEWLKIQLKGECIRAGIKEYKINQTNFKKEPNIKNCGSILYKSIHTFPQQGSP
jgi:hypothetical protein